MDALLEKARDIYEGTIDFKGQAFTDFLSTLLLTLFGIISLFVGYVNQDIYQTLYMGLGGAGLTALVVVPPWPVYNLNPERWLSARSGVGSYANVEVTKSE